MTSIITDSYGQPLTSGFSPLTVEINGDLWILPPGPNTAQSFFIVELDTPTPLYASDMGYVTRPSDFATPRVYRPLVDQSFEIDRMVGLVPGSQSTAGNGSVRLTNLNRIFDTFIQGVNSDSRAIRIFIGNKVYDQTRGIYVDPAYSALSPFFAGTAGGWTLSETELEIPLFDATYWADRALQTNTYPGGGGLNGGADLAGKFIPIARGGTSLFPIRQVPLTSLDAVNLIYQYTDGPGTVVTLYEGGAPVFVYDGDVADLYAGTAPSPGHYRTCNAMGLVQMGSTPVRAMTADITASFPTQGLVSTAAAIARYVLTETMGLPLSMIDTTSFINVDSSYSYIAGFYIDSTDRALDVIRSLLWSVGASLYTTRAGKLAALSIRAVNAVFGGSTISTANAISIEPQELPAPLNPPTIEWRVQCCRNYLVQTSDYNGAITQTQKNTISQEYQSGAGAASSSIAGVLRPSHPDPVPTYLLNPNDAASLAQDWRNLWGLGYSTKQWVITMSITAAAGLDIGNVITLRWNVDNLASGRPAMIVGEQVRTFDDTVQFTILVAGTP